jgi:CheY-like chemotaxis protein
MANILIVDDDILIAESNKFIIRRAGYNTAGIAVDGKEAIELTKEKKPDVILMDINLSGTMDGITAAEEIKKIADIPIIFVTAYTDSATKERAKKVRPSGYLVKPFDRRALEELIYNVLRKTSADLAGT